MFKKNRIKKEIKKCVKQIEKIEHLRYRSQAALVEAILKSESPNDEDTDYFNKYTAQIEEVRAHIHDLKTELAELDNK